MMRILGVLCALSLSLAPMLSEAKPPKKGKAAKVAKKGKKAAAPKQASEQTKKAIGELAGRYKWGMSPQQVIALIQADIKKAYGAKMKKTAAPLEQDRLRKEMSGELAKVKNSLMKFTGQKTSWDISIVDKEFAHRNNESMLVHWEPNQRRFLFFYEDKLWKQFIALNADLFEGKTFAQFADMVASRYGEPKRVMSVDGRGKEILDHLEWPPAGDFQLNAVDHTNLYGNYCLVLARTSILDGMDKRRAEANPDHGRRSGIDMIMKGKHSTKGDGNADVVDQITGQQARKPTLVEDLDAPPQPAPTAPTKKKKKGKKR